MINLIKFIGSHESDPSANVVVSEQIVNFFADRDLNADQESALLAMCTLANERLSTYTDRPDKTAAGNVLTIAMSALNTLWAVRAAGEQVREIDQRHVFPERFSDPANEEEAETPLSFHESTRRFQRDLLASDRFALDVVAEVDHAGFTLLRFGDDVNGRRPSPLARFDALVRYGNGSRGNVGHGVLAHAYTGWGGAAVPGVMGVSNPLPGQGGTEPESVAEARLFAPPSIRTQKRAVTESDWEAWTLQQEVWAWRVWTSVRSTNNQSAAS